MKKHQYPNSRNTYLQDEKLNHEFNSRSILKTLRYAVPYRKIIVPMIILMFAISFITLLPSYINVYLIDNVISTDTGILGFDMQTSAIILVSAVALIAVCDILFAFFRSFFMTSVGHNMVRDIRKESFEKLQKFSFDYYDSRPGGKILIRLTTYLDELADIFASVFINLLVDIVKVIVLTGLLFILNWFLALVVLAVMIPMGVVLYFLRRTTANKLRKYKTTMGNKYAFLAENIQGRTIIQSYNRTTKNAKIYNDLNEKTNETFMDYTRFNQLYFPFTDGFFYIGMFAVYAVVLFFATGSLEIEGITLGVVVSFISYLGMFSSPLNNIMTAIQDITSASSSLERVFEITDLTEKVKESENAIELDDIIGDVRFDGVTFKYPDADYNIIENFNLYIPAGKMVALVGPSGGGKSTLVSLLPRFHEVTEGAIHIDGINIRDISIQSLRAHIGTMLQENYMFWNTVMDNIRVAKPDATDEECIDAAKKAKAHDFIMQMKDGYDTIVYENGESLSSGMRQLIALSRLMLTRPKLIILDEATSSVDSILEEQIRESIYELMEGRTCFIVAHRLSTVKKADCILYIDSTGIAEAGTHDELMEKKGKYYALVQH